jgi:hypothetical protein
MKWIHPKLSHAAAVAALAFSTGAVGCRNQSGAVGNPFLAPDRVPPPATRSLLPGQAQPYYPGDPLPVMQSGTAQGADSARLAAGESQPMPSAGTNLAWNSPSSASSTAASPEPQALASAEPSVAIPADSDSLRYSLPEPVEPQPFTPIAASPLAMSQQAGPLAATPAPQVVLPATYSVPVSGSTEAAASSPWRTPYRLARATVFDDEFRATRHGGEQYGRAATGGFFAGGDYADTADSTTGLRRRAANGRQ